MVVKIVTTKAGTGSASVASTMAHGTTSVAAMLVVLQTASSVSVRRAIAAAARLASPGLAPRFSLAALT